MDDLPDYESDNENVEVQTEENLDDLPDYESNDENVEAEPSLKSKENLDDLPDYESDNENVEVETEEILDDLPDYESDDENVEVANTMLGHVDNEMATNAAGKPNSSQFKTINDNLFYGPDMEEASATEVIDFATRSTQDISAIDDDSYDLPDYESDTPDARVSGYV